MEDELIFNNYLYEKDDYNEDLFLDDEFLKPSNILMECDESLSTNKENITMNIPEFKEIELKRLKQKDEFLFSPTKLIYDDKELDNLDEEKEENNNYLFKPIDLLYEDHLELFNKRREQGIVLSSSKKRCNEKEKKNIVEKPKTFLGRLKAEIKEKVLDKK